jgi:hypothetical protein
VGAPLLRAYFREKNRDEAHRSRRIGRPCTHATICSCDWMLGRPPIFDVARWMRFLAANTKWAISFSDGQLPERQRPVTLSERQLPETPSTKKYPGFN